jgi:hypothetical protein
MLAMTWVVTWQACDDVVLTWHDCGDVALCGDDVACL